MDPPSPATPCVAVHGNSPENSQLSTFTAGAAQRNNPRETRVRGLLMEKEFRKKQQMNKFETRSVDTKRIKFVICYLLLFADHTKRANNKYKCGKTWTHYCTLSLSHQRISNRSISHQINWTSASVSHSIKRSLSTLWRELLCSCAAYVPRQSITP